jgi:hypothetical protein
MHLRSCGLLTPVCLFSVIACGDDPVAGDDTGTTSASTTDASTTGDPPTTSVTPPTTDDASTTDAAPAPAIARGIRLTRVTATQGVQTEIVRDGLELPPEDYAVPLISRRKTVLRADWSLHASFTPRELLARLTVHTPEGDTHVDEYKALVDGPSNDGDFDRTFRWQLPAELVRPGMEYRIEAFETDPDYSDGEVSDPPPILPLAGRGKLVVEDHPMVMKVELIPIKHVLDGMTCMPTITDADVLELKKWLEQHNPLERADITVLDPMEYTASIGTSEQGFVPVLTELGLRRADTTPPPNVYWYGLLESCDAYPPGPPRPGLRHPRRPHHEPRLPAHRHRPLPRQRRSKPATPSSTRSATPRAATTSAAAAARPATTPPTPIPTAASAAGATASTTPSCARPPASATT